MKEVAEELKNLLENYNTDYGAVQIYVNGIYVYIVTHNGGWSENEGLEGDLNIANNFKLLDLHPITIFKLVNYEGQYNSLLEEQEAYVEKKNVEFEWRLGQWGNMDK